jgi:hypothetical protein
MVVRNISGIAAKLWALGIKRINGLAANRKTKFDCRGTSPADAHLLSQETVLADLQKAFEPKATVRRPTGVTADKCNCD